MSKVWGSILALSLLLASTAHASSLSTFEAKLKSTSVLSWFTATLPNPPVATKPPVSTSPAQICVRDVREYEAVVNQLPAIFRAGEFYAIHDSWTLKGGLHISKAGSRFVIEAHGRMLMTSLDEDENIKLMCFKGPSVEVDLDDGRFDTMTIESGGIRFHSFLFKPVSAATYTKLVSSL